MITDITKMSEVSKTNLRRLNGIGTIMIEIRNGDLRTNLKMRSFRL